jgi:3-oxoadipate enol-lactonase
MWDGQLAGLSDLARVVSLDLSGFGETPARPGEAPFTMEEMADEVLALADALGFHQFVAGGLSMGGYVVLAMHRRAPDRISGMLLCDTRAEPDTPEARKERLILADKVLAGGTGILVEKQVRMLLSPDTLARRRDLAVATEVMIRRASPSGVAAALRGMAERPDARPQLPTIGVPTLVVAGAEDAIVPLATHQAMAAQIPDAELAIIPGAGHLSPFESPEPVNAAVRELIRRVTAHPPSGQGLGCQP